MEVKYFTPEIQAGQWDFIIPVGQRTPESKAPISWVYLPEGVHTVQIMWRGSKDMVIRTRAKSSISAGTQILNAGANNANPRVIQVVSPPGGLELLFGTINIVTAADIASTSTVWAGATIYIGANEAL